MQSIYCLQAGKASETVNRLTDTSKYTGSHKQRFDETGKGKGIAGRKNVVDDSGYVSGLLIHFSIYFEMMRIGFNYYLFSSFEFQDTSTLRRTTKRIKLSAWAFFF